MHLQYADMPRVVKLIPSVLDAVAVCRHAKSGQFEFKCI